MSPLLCVLYDYWHSAYYYYYILRYELGTEGRGLSHMTALLHAHMFSEQGIKLKWISERIGRYVLVGGMVVSWL